MNKTKITDIRAIVLERAGSGGDYYDHENGHWLVDSLIATLNVKGIWITNNLLLLFINSML